MSSWQIIGRGKANQRESGKAFAESGQECFPRGSFAFADESQRDGWGDDNDFAADEIGRAVRFGKIEHHGGQAIDFGFTFVIDFVGVINVGGEEGLERGFELGGFLFWRVSLNGLKEEFDLERFGAVGDAWIGEGKDIAVEGSLPAFGDSPQILTSGVFIFDEGKGRLGNFPAAAKQQGEENQKDGETI